MTFSLLRVFLQVAVFWHVVHTRYTLITLAAQLS